MIWALILLLLTFLCDKWAFEPTLSNQIKDVWLADMPEISQKEMEGLRDEAWEMFDFGWRNYIHLAFPRDNLLPVSCKGRDWQGGMSITLLDALDTFLLMNRKKDMEDALRKIEQYVHFDMDTKVHVFEVVIRVLGGLLSGHLLLERSPEAFPNYDGILLDKAIDIAQRLRPAFDSPSGLPYLFVNLRKGKLATLDKNSNTTCTACAGTLLLEFGHLSALTGDPQWVNLAEHAAEAMYDRRSSLGLVGGSINVDSSAWVSREATTGPGVDSYYEYLLKSYLTFGNFEHLQMFIELYGSVMQQLQPPPYLPGNAFLVSAHMDSGRLSRTFVSSLAAFWPAMQALVGLEKEAVQLHEGFLSAWREFGWLPELFGLELEQIDPHDPGYQLRPESIESNYILYALTQDPKYLDSARRIQQILNTHNRVECGFASINNVTTGDHNDIQESYFLSETVKYLYLTFVEGSEALLDYFIFSTEGHLLPPQPPADQEAAAAERRAYSEAVAESRLEPKCARLCEPPDPVAQAAASSKLQQAFPLLHFDAADAALIQRRRCVACTQVTKHMGSRPAADSSLKIEQLSLAAQTGLDKSQVLSQILCLVDVHPSTEQLYCSSLRSITVHDLEHGLPGNAVLLQLSWIAQPLLHAAVLLVAPQGGPVGRAAHVSNVLVVPGAAAEFGPSLVDMTPACAEHLLDLAAAWADAAASTAALEGSEAAKSLSVVGGRSGAGGKGNAAEGAQGVLQIDSGPAEGVPRSAEGAGTDGFSQPLEPPGPVCALLSPLLGGLLPQQAGQQLVAAVQAAMLGGSCSATTGDNSLERGSCSTTTAADSSEGESCRARAGAQSSEGRSCGATTGADSSEGGSCGTTTGADSSEGEAAGTGMEFAGESLRSVGGAGAGLGERTSGGADNDQQMSEGVLEEDLCMGGQNLEHKQQQQQQQQEAKHMLSQAEAVDERQQSAAPLEGDISRGVLEKWGNHERSGDSRSKAGGARGRAEQHAVKPQQQKQQQQQQQQRTAGKQGKDTSGGSIEREGPTYVDTHSHCLDWAQEGECSANSVWMLEFCPVACQQCTPTTREMSESGAAQTHTPAAAAAAAASGSSISADSAAQQKHEDPGARHGENVIHDAQGHEIFQRGQAEEHEAGPMELSPRMADPHSWGPCERVPLTHGPAILADPPDACVPHLYNAHLLARAVVVAIRGGCAFAAKAQAAQAAGAAAFVVLSLAEEEVVVMGGMADAKGAKDVSIPGMLMGRTAALLLLRELHTAAAHGLLWPEVTLALDPHAQEAKDRTYEEGQSADQQPGADGRVRSRPGSQQLGMLVPSSSIRHIQKLITTRDQDLQSMLMDIAADDEALLLLLQIARESGPNSPSQIQKRQIRMQNDRAT